jgi:tetratricopeptide (TPR) repeat protein
VTFKQNLYAFIAAMLIFPSIYAHAKPKEKQSEAPPHPSISCSFPSDLPDQSKFMGSKDIELKEISDAKTKSLFYTWLGNYAYYGLRRDEAISHLNNALSLYPENHFALFYRGCVRSDMRPRSDADFILAEADFLELTRLVPNSKEGWKNLKQLYGTIKDNSKILAAFDKALEKNPLATGALHARADHFLYRRNYIASLRDYAKANQIDPKFIIPDDNIQAYLSQEAYWKSIVEEFSSELRKNPNEQLLRFHRALLLRRKTLFDEARNDFDHLINQSPENWLYHKERSALNFQQNQFENALTDVQKAMVLNPEALGLLIERGNIHLKLKQFDKAILDYDQANKKVPHCGIECNYKLETMKFNFFDKTLFDIAKTQYDQALKIDSKNGLFYYARALLYSSDEKYINFAIADMRTAQGLKFNTPRYDASYGQILLIAKRFPEALKYYNKSIIKDRRDSISLKGRAATYLEMNKFALAAADYDRAEELDYYPNTILSCRARVLGRIDLQKAWASCDKALSQIPSLEKLNELKIDPKRFTIYFLTVGRASLLRPVTLTFAEGIYRTGLKYDPSNATMRYGLGMALRAIGKTAEGDTEITEALKLDPKAETKFEKLAFEI